MTDKRVSVMMPVKIDHKWQIPMTICAITTLRCTTEIPFELVIALKNPDTVLPAMDDCVDRWVMCPKGTSATEDCNLGLDACSGTHAIYTGNDVFVRPGWLEALLECWKIGDCGAATLAAGDLKHKSVRRIMEGWYGPFMMFDAKRRFDAETFPASFADTDLVMRIYGEGLRMYRNWAVVIQHLTHSTMGAADFDQAKGRFAAKHAGSNLMMYRALTEGWQI